MCAFRLGPPDQPNHFYVHKTQVVFPRHEPLRRVLSRACPGVSSLHKHVALKGCRTGTTITRCTEAGAYARDFVTAVVATLQASLGGGLVSPPQERKCGGDAEDVGERESADFALTEEEQRERERIPCTRGPDGGDCGCCPACCQGLQGCGLCTKCWEQGIRRGWAARERKCGGGGQNDEGTPADDQFRSFAARVISEAARASSSDAVAPSAEVEEEIEEAGEVRDEADREGTGATEAENGTEGEDGAEAENGAEAESVAEAEDGAEAEEEGRGSEGEAAAVREVKTEVSVVRSPRRRILTRTRLGPGREVEESQTRRQVRGMTHWRTIGKFGLRRAV